MKSSKLNVELQSRVYKLLEKVESATQLNTVIREMQSQWDDVVKNSLVVGDYVNVVEVKKTKTVKSVGWVKKVNKTKALVEMRGGSYRVPFSMIEKLIKRGKNVRRQKNSETVGIFGRTTGVILRKLRKFSKGLVLKVREESQNNLKISLDNFVRLVIITT